MSWNPRTELMLTAKKYVGVHEEGGDNKGLMVERFQKAVDGVASGEAWCCAFLQFCIKEVEAKLNIKSPIFKSESVWEMYHQSNASCRVSHGIQGFVICWSVPPGTKKGHTGIIIDTTPDNRFLTIEGNTNEAGSREVDGVYQKSRSLTGSDTFKVLGFLDPWCL